MRQAWLHAELQPNWATAALRFFFIATWTARAKESSAASLPTAYCGEPSASAMHLHTAWTNAPYATLRKSTTHPSGSNLPFVPLSQKRDHLHVDGGACVCVVSQSFHCISNQ